MIKRFWPEQKEEAKAFIKGTNYIMALAYEAWTDCDEILVFRDMEEYEKYKAENFTSVYSGWITLDFKL